ncbi:hypothetical protein EDD11_003309 [Mortierella claussenii]|nr:hypothetical protein EDD11_003309 [Mortierella claussenii]
MGIKSTPSCVSLGVVGNGTSAAATASVVASGGSQTSLLPLVGRDYLSYSSLNATLASGVIVAESTPRPLSSMEYAESWLPTVTPTTTMATTAQADVVEHKPIPCSSPTDDNNDPCMALGQHEGTCSGSITTIANATVARLSTDQQSIHPLEFDPELDAMLSLQQDQPTEGSTVVQTSMNEQPSLQLQRPALRKKTSFAAKLRKVFISKQGCARDLETQGDTMSLSSSPNDKTVGYLQINGVLTSASSSKSFVADQHRGSVSSNSSDDTAPGGLHEFRRGSGQTLTPLTSPETSPLSSPTIESCATLTTAIAGVHSHEVEAPSTSPTSAPGTDSATGDAEDSEVPLVTTAEPIEISNSIKELQPTPTRTIKKRLSFASISSFFGNRNDPQERRAKQPRASSVPHVENPLVVVGRQIAGFQRRHSLNDLDANNTTGKEYQNASRGVTTPWEKTRASAQGRAANGPSSTSTAAATPRAPVKKLSLNSMFKNGRKKSAGLPVPVPPVPMKPLKSALVHRPPAFANTTTRVHLVRNSSRRRSASLRSQSSSYRRQYRHTHHPPQAQRHLQNQINSTDPLVRLAEANHTLASFSRRGSAQDDGYHHLHYEQQLTLLEHDFCASPLASEAPGGGLSDRVSPSAFNTAPSARMLPLIGNKQHAPVSGPNHCSPLHNPLATLSRSSSCCSFSSASDDTSSSRRSSSSTNSRSSSLCSTRYEVTSAGAIGPSNDQSFNPLLPASAARISVDQIVMDSCHDTSMNTDTSSTAYESTISSASGEIFSTSSPNTHTKVGSLPLVATSDRQTMQLRNGVYSSQHEHVHQQHQQPNYHHLQHQQQVVAPHSYGHESDLKLETHHSRHPELEHPHFLGHHEHDHNYNQAHQHHRLHQFRQYQYQQHPYHQSEFYYKESHPYSTQYPPRPQRHLKFSTKEPTVHATWTPEQYDRTSDTSITASRLTPAIAQKIKVELNHFKRQEMEVHQDSRIYTHFFT